MTKLFKDLAGEEFSVEMIEHDISNYEVLFHVTLKSRRSRIEKEGLKILQEPYKSLDKTGLIFVSYPVNMDTGDCFRWSDEHYSLIVLDAKALKNAGYIFYEDPFSKKDQSSLRNHLCIDRDIPKQFVKTVKEF